MASVKRPKHYLEIILNAIGSKPAMAIMAIWSLAWWGWLTHKHLADDNLNTAISIWTMLLDVFIVMAANFQRRQDRKLLRAIFRMLLQGVQERAEIRAQNVEILRNQRAIMAALNVQAPP